jgi:two-component system, chemotaxis family, CheB/CheR fusion protein
MDAPFPIVGVGASAGGVEALELLFKAMPTEPGMAFIIITHLAPKRESMLPEILARDTRMPVLVAEHDQPVRPDHIYVVPADSVLQIAKGRLRIRTIADGRERTPIDSFFASLADDQAEYAIGIVLSGAGSDGTLGIKAIKEHGGLTLAQATDHSGPRHSGMPESAIASGLVDLAVPVESMPEKLVAYARSFEILKEADKDEQAEATRRAICAILLEQTGHDFGGYKTRTFYRRIERRMQVLQIASLAAYADLLRQDAGEANILFRDLLIGVTNFFRDAKAFEALQQLVMPRLFEGKRALDTIRVWVPGCATGEEVYSLAIMLREQAEQNRSRSKIQIFATDIDEAALAVARTGRYPDTLLQGVSKERLERFFTSEGTSYVINKPIRDMCVFSSHSVVRDPPFSRMDLISCRNLLIYLNSELQGHVIPIFHYALKPNGFLFLGTSENISQHGDLFTSVDKKNRVFQRREAGAALPHLPVVFRRHGAAGGGSAETKEPTGRSLRQSVEARVLERYGPAHVVVTREGDVINYSAGTGKYLEPPPGRPSNLEQLERELLETRERLQSMAEEYETAIEELKSSNEEMVSVNEELQSTNEELETSKEELQSVNEELQTVNHELTTKIDELDRANSDLRNLYESTDVAIVFLDRELVIRSFTPAVTRIFSLIPTDRGRPLTDIAHHLDYSELPQDIQQVFGARQPLERRVHRRDGTAHYIVRALPYWTGSGKVEGAILTFSDVTSLVQAEAQQRLLLGELNSRVKNMLNVMVSVATETLSRDDAAREALLDRMQAMAHSYELVSHDHWGDVPLLDVVRQEMERYGAGRADRVMIQGPEVLLEPKLALSLGMIIHELGTNATRHGSLSVPGGSLEVSWAIETCSADTLVLDWIERGGPSLTKPPRNGFGLTFIDREVTSGLGGEARIEFEQGGLRANLRIPLGSG